MYGTYNLWSYTVVVKLLQLREEDFFPVLIIKMYYFYVNTLCCIYNKVTPLSATDCHLALDLSEIFMVAT